MLTKDLILNRGGDVGRNGGKTQDFRPQPIVYEEFKQRHDCRGESEMSYSWCTDVGLGSKFLLSTNAMAILTDSSSSM